MKFICDKSNPRMNQFMNEFEEFTKMSKEKIAFLKAQAKSLDEQKKKLWDDFFLDLKKEGLIDKDVSHDTHTMSLSDDRTQLFIEKDEDRDGIPDFIRRLL